MDTYSDSITEEYKKSQYTMITTHVAVGSLYSRYDEFDVVVNMAYRYDGDGFIKHQTTIHSEKGKMLIKIGIHDRPTEPLDTILPEIIPILLTALEEKKKILIHCQAGISRSASVAIALLAKWKGVSLSESLRYVQGKRPIVCPNSGFYEMLVQYLS